MAVDPALDQNFVGWRQAGTSDPTSFKNFKGWTKLVGVEDVMMPNGCATCIASY